MTQDTIVATTSRFCIAGRSLKPLIASGGVPTLGGPRGELSVLSHIADRDAPDEHTGENKHSPRVPIVQLRLGGFAAGP